MGDIIKEIVYIVSAIVSAIASIITIIDYFKK